VPMLVVEGSSLYNHVKGEGKPIVFIHPPWLTCTTFVYQVEQLSKKYKVITFDIEKLPYSVKLKTSECITKQ